MTQNQGSQLQINIKKDEAARALVLEDHLKFVLGAQKNTNYKPWKNVNAPVNPHSCFGNFPDEHMKVLLLFTGHKTLAH